MERDRRSLQSQSEKAVPLIPEEEVKNPNNDAPWEKSELDRMLDLFFAGCHPKRLAVMFGRNPKAIRRQLEMFAYNTLDYATRYQPVRRISRKGKKFSPNEMRIIRCHAERGIPVEVTARLLMRDPSEIQPPKRYKPTNPEITLVPTMDLIWALRYAFFHYNTRVISDEEYDLMVKEEIEFGGKEVEFETLKNSVVPDRIKSLAIYLVLKMENK